MHGSVGFECGTAYGKQLKTIHKHYDQPVRKRKNKRKGKGRQAGRLICIIGRLKTPREYTGRWVKGSKDKEKEKKERATGDRRRVFEREEEGMKGRKNMWAPRKKEKKEIVMMMPMPMLNDLLSLSIVDCSCQCVCV